MTIRRVVRRAAFAIALGSAATWATMSTTNAMPTEAGNPCMEGPCAQGALFSDAMKHNSEGDPILCYSIGTDFGGTGWPEGNVSTAQATVLYSYGDTECLLKMRGVTILRIFNALISSTKFDGVSQGATANKMLQFNGLKIKYSTTLPPSNRLLSIKYWDKTTSAYIPINRTELYDVGGLKYDYKFVAPYNQWTKVMKLAGETVQCEVQKMAKGVLVTQFLEANSPYTIPDVSDVITKEEGGTALVIEETAEYCKSLTPAAFLEETLASCTPCPADQISTGTACAQPMAVSALSMPSSVPDVCLTGDCGQGMLVADTLLAEAQAAGDVQMAYVSGAALAGEGWPAGPIKVINLIKMYPHPERSICTAVLRGLTVLRLLQDSVAAKTLPGSATGAADQPPLQLAGLRVHYSTTHDASARLVKVEVKDGAGWKGLERLAFYTVAATDADMKQLEPYMQLTADPAMPGETAPNCSTRKAQAALIAHVKGVGQLSFPTAADTRVIGTADGVPLVVKQSPDICKTMNPSSFFDGPLSSCVPCPVGQVSLGSSCAASSGGASGGSSVTGALLSIAPGQAGGQNSETGPTAGAAGIGQSSGSPKSGNSAGLIAGTAVGVVALLVVGAAVGFIVMRRRAAGMQADDGLDTRLNLMTEVDVDDKNTEHAADVLVVDVAAPDPDDVV